MIRPPSAQRPWDTFITSPKESAIVRPPVRPGEGATEADLEQYKQDSEAWVAKIRAARETGDWAPVTVTGEQPTRFTLDHIDPEAWREIQSRASLPDDCERKIEMPVALLLLFRLAIRSISGFERIEREPDPRWNHWMMAPLKLVAQLDEIDKSIVAEVGQLVLARLVGDRPLS